MTKVLFVLKRRVNYGNSFGLHNSCKFIVNFLNKSGIPSKVVEVIDNNCIDKAVHEYQPSHVIIEALWVVPEKFPVLMKLHPKIKWFVRLHSNLPFLANEGVAIEWIKAYKKIPNLYVCGNSSKLKEELDNALNIKTVYLPNIYFPNEVPKTKHPHEKPFLDFACFGAIRPLKNTLIQAFAAVNYADSVDKILRFHVNSRTEQQGENVIRNLKALFWGSKHRLIIHDWEGHYEFLTLIAKMDLGLQVSLTESFNIVAADFAVLDVPIVGSPEIPWLSSFYKANPTDIKDIENKISFAMFWKIISLQRVNRSHLSAWNREAKKVWLNFLGKQS